MSRADQQIHDRYEALLFAKTPELGRRAARELVKAVLGEDGAGKSLEEALRECCRKLRPSRDPREQLRFENELVEMGIWPGGSQRIAA